VTPPLGTRGPALAASTISPPSVRSCGTRFSNTQEGPNRCRSAPISDPLFRGFGIPNRSTASLVQRAGRDHPFPIFAGSPWRERDLARRVRHGSPTIQGKKLRDSGQPGSASLVNIKHLDSEPAVKVPRPRSLQGDHWLGSR
jgi:hypothetical protein